VKKYYCGIRYKELMKRLVILMICFCLTCPVFAYKYGSYEEVKVSTTIPAKDFDKLFLVFLMFFSSVIVDIIFYTMGEKQQSTEYFRDQQVGYAWSMNKRKFKNRFAFFYKFPIIKRKYVISFNRGK
jgi:hypothetical protein